VAQAQLVGTVKVTGCASPWSTTSTAFASFATQTGCSYAVTGQALAPTTNIPAIRFANLAPGDYRLEYEGSLYTSATAGRQDAYFQFYDGSNEYREVSTIGGTTVGDFKPNFSASYTYTAPQSNITLQVRAKTSNSQTTFIYGTTSQPGVIKLYYFPTQSQLAVSSAQTDYDWTSYGTTSDFTGFGTVSNIQLQHSRVGSNLMIRGKFTSGISTATEARIALPSGLVAADTTKIPSIQIAGKVNTNANAATYFSGGTVLIEPSVGYFTFGRESSTANGLTKVQGSTMTVSGDLVSFFATIPIQGWTTNQRASTLVGSVTSNASGAERIERATIANSGTATITSQSGSWLTSATRSSAGVIDLVWPSSTWSSAPTCIVATVAPNADRQVVITNAETTTGMSIGTTNTTTPTDYPVRVICMGAR
jgi:hypothetical protein